MKTNYTPEEKMLTKDCPFVDRRCTCRNCVAWDGTTKEINTAYSDNTYPGPNFIKDRDFVINNKNDKIGNRLMNRFEKLNCNLEDLRGVSYKTLRKLIKDIEGFGLVTLKELYWGYANVPEKKYIEIGRCKRLGE